MQIQSIELFTMIQMSLSHHGSHQNTLISKMFIKWHMLHLCSLFLYCSAYSWFLTVFPCLSSWQTLKPLVFSYFHHLLQPAVHWRPIHLVMPEVTDALRNHHTAERTKDNITSRNSREKYNCNPRQGLTWQTLDHKPLLS